MKANELRIGNWVEDTEHFKGYFQVNRISSLTVESPEWTLEYNEIKPIPLTEEWLLKFGLKQIGGSFELNDDNFSLSFEGIEAFLCYGGYVEQSRPVNCKYVHQLQNLYFALTGTELTITN